MGFVRELSKPGSYNTEVCIFVLFGAELCSLYIPLSVLPAVACVISYPDLTLYLGTRL